MARREEGDALWQAPAPVAGRGAYAIRALHGVRTGGRAAALMRINIWIVLGVLLVLFAITRLGRHQQDIQRICADDPSASVCER
jgi:hypothetical protein